MSVAVDEPVIKKSKLSTNVDSPNDSPGKIISDEISETVEHDDGFPAESNIVEMLEEVEFAEPYPTITDRYFTPYYRIDVRMPGDDVCVQVHSNRICMITLAPSHVIFEKPIDKVTFKVSDKLDRSLNKVSGKGKHGAQPLQVDSNICFVTSSDDKTIPIKCCMHGKLVEINEALLDNPELLRQPLHHGGYIAIVLPNLKFLDKITSSFLTQEQYELALLRRKKE